MWSRGDFVELDGLLAVVVGGEGEPEVPDDHVAVWFGDPRSVRKSDGGSGGQSPEVWTVPADLLVRAAGPSIKH